MLLQQPAPCQLVAFSPDSRLLLTASMDGSVRLHDVAAGKQLRQFRMVDADVAQAGPQGQARSTAGAGAVTPPLAAAAAAAAAATGAPTVMALSWFPDSRRFLVGTHRGLVVYDAQQSGAPPRRLPCAHSYGGWLQERAVLGGASGVLGVRTGVQAAWLLPAALGGPARTRRRAGWAAPAARAPPAAPPAAVYDALVGPGGSCIITVGQDKRIAFTR